MSHSPSVASISASLALNHASQYSTQPANCQCPLGFGTFDVNGPEQSLAGAYYLPSFPDPIIEPDGIDLFPADVEEVWNEYQKDTTNQSVLIMKKRAEMREILMHPCVLLWDLFHLDPKHPEDREELARLQNTKLGLAPV